jgi:hypothetical protein
LSVIQNPWKRFLCQTYELTVTAPGMLSARTMFYRHEFSAKFKDEKSCLNVYLSSLSPSDFFFHHCKYILHSSVWTLLYFTFFQLKPLIFFKRMGLIHYIVLKIMKWKTILSIPSLYKFTPIISLIFRVGYLKKKMYIYIPRYTVVFAKDRSIYHSIPQIKFWSPYAVIRHILISSTIDTEIRMTTWNIDLYTVIICIVTRIDAFYVHKIIYEMTTIIKKNVNAPSQSPCDMCNHSGFA